MSTEELQFMKNFGSVEDRQAARRIEARQFHSQHHEMILNKNREIVCKSCDTVECTLTEEEYKDWMQQNGEAAKRKEQMKRIRPKYRANYSNNGQSLILVSQGETLDQYSDRIEGLVNW